MNGAIPLFPLCSFIAWRGTTLSYRHRRHQVYNVSILSFRRVLYVVCFLLGNSPASEV